MAWNSLKVSEAEENIRLDRFLRIYFSSLNQSQIQKMLRKKDIRVNGGKKEASYHLQKGDEVSVWKCQITPLKKENTDESDILKQIVIYKDDNIVVLNKPSGLAVQGGSGISKSIDMFLDTLKFDYSERPRLVHRIDKDTSGILVLARTRKMAQLLTKLFSEHKIKKKYLAVVDGKTEKKEGTFNFPLIKKYVSGQERVCVDFKEGLPAITHYRVLEHNENYSFLKLSPISGRTHQLRVHCSYVKCPLLGDKKYGFSDKEKLKLHLHAFQIEIPINGKVICLKAPLPGHILKTLRKLGFSKFEGEL